MKKSTTTIILIVLIIGLIGSGVALYAMRNNDPVEESTTASTTAESTSADDQNSSVPTTTEVATQEESTTRSNGYIGKTGEISVSEVFDKLDEYYGKGYEINCFDATVEKPVFKVTNTSTGDEYARVQVDLNTSIATETILSTNEVKEFSLFG